MNNRINSLFLGVGVLLAAPAMAEPSAEQKGLQIAQQADQREQGFGDTRATLTMELHNRNGDKSVRSLRTLTLEVEDDGDKSMSIFDEPADVKGTAMLTYTHKLKDDNQWLYLPALKRVKRISSSNKSGPFMGSEFAYEDLSSQEVEKYTYKWLRDEPCGEWQCFVIERYPTYKKSGYTRQQVWLDQDEYRMVKVDFYDRKDSLLKTLTSSEFAHYLDKYWRPGKMEMVNHLNGKTSILTFSDYQFQTGLTDKDFDKNSLKRAR